VIKPNVVFEIHTTHYL